MSRPYTISAAVLERAAEAAQRGGQTIISPNFVTPHIHQLANSPAEKDARAGRLR